MTMQMLLWVETNGWGGLLDIPLRPLSPCLWVWGAVSTRTKRMMRHSAATRRHYRETTHSAENNWRRSWWGIQSSKGVGAGGREGGRSTDLKVLIQTDHRPSFFCSRVGYYSSYIEIVEIKSVANRINSYTSGLLSVLSLRIDFRNSFILTGGPSMNALTR